MSKTAPRLLESYDHQSFLIFLVYRVGKIEHMVSPVVSLIVSFDVMDEVMKTSAFFILY